MQEARVQAIFFATCLAIFLWYKLHKKLPSVTHPEMNRSHNFFGATILLREVKVSSTFLNNPRNAATNFSNAAERCYSSQCCLAMAQQNCIKKLPSVTAPLGKWDSVEDCVQDATKACAHSLCDLSLHLSLHAFLGEPPTICQYHQISSLQSKLLTDHAPFLEFCEVINKSFHCLLISTTTQVN